MRVSRDWRGKVLGAPPLDAALIAARYEAGWRFAAITIDDRGLPEGVAPMLYVRPGGKLSFVSVEDLQTAQPLAGDLAVVLTAPEKLSSIRKTDVEYAAARR